MIHLLPSFHRLRRFLAADRGIALPMALCAMASVGALATTAISYTTTN